MTKSEKTTIEIKLADCDSESLGNLPVRIEVSDFAISIYPHGYGDSGSADGHGCPLFIEFHQGRLRVVAFPDINSEELKIIDLSGAREDQRRDADESNEMTPLQRGRTFNEFMDQIN